MSSRARRTEPYYVGVTNELIKRVWQHRQGTHDGFTKKYHVNRLVYYESFERIEDAIKREKRLKRWRREWKIELIEKENPEWRDLYDGLF